MQSFFVSLADRPAFAIAVAAFLSGVALFYVVMQRTRRRQIENSKRGRQ
jgi:uncharacterized membrane protein